MSILIKGMKMPKNCEECNLESFCDLWVDAKRMCGEGFTDSKARVKATIRHPNCPLIEVPKHGDLIDRSKLAWTPIDITDLPYRECLPVYLKEDVDFAPVVVESEE